ncbi:MAG: hypothetical protein ACTSW1_11315 [Candidatus Hodarchaeales archaeon]
MKIQGENIMVRKVLLVFFIVLIVGSPSIVTICRLDSSELPSNSNVNISHHVPRLSSHTNFSKAELLVSLKPDVKLSTQESIYSNRSREEAQNETSSSTVVPRNFLPVKKLLSQFDVVIDNLYPKAIEINKSSIKYLLNFTIVDGEGSSSDIIQNITLFRVDNSSEYYKITTWQNFTYLGGTDYSLRFILNETIISSLTLGYYNLTLFTKVVTVESSSTISLPAKDLNVKIMSLSPLGFNNKYDYNQTFDVKIEVKETLDGVTYNAITYLPALYDENGSIVNPNTTIISSTKDTEVFLYFSKFISNNSLEGTYTFNVTLSAERARQFDEADHIFSVLITSPDGIAENVNTTVQAKSTILLVKVKEVYIGSKRFNWDNITNSGKEHATFRINVNTSVKVSYDIYTDTGDLYTSAGQVVTYQNPNSPDDPFAILTNTSFADGFDSIVLESNITSPSEGYPLFIYVRGHQTSQANYTSNVTIYWDLLGYNLNYFDNKGETGDKGLGLDVNETWTLTFTVIYVSDGSLAYSSSIQYRYPDDNTGWINLTDGQGSDSRDGSFIINRTESSAKIVLLEVRIINGSIQDYSGTNYVNQTKGEEIFSLTIIWTYLKINMTSSEVDSRLGILQSTDINISVTWAHNASLPFNGIVYAREDEERERAISITDGKGVWAGVVNDAVGKYRYSMSRVDDSTFGITSFFNSSEGVDVFVEIIWDAIEFTFSNSYDNSTDPLLQVWEASVNSSWGFFVNINTNATLYVYGRHLYDNSSFHGVALLYALTTGANYTLSFDSNGIAVWKGDLSSVKLPVEFSVMAITVSTEVDWGVMRIGTWIQVEITWDRLIVILEAKRSYSHGSWADIYVKYAYEVSPIAVNPSHVTYDLTLYNGTIQNISWTHFRDFSLQAVKRDYFVTNFYDSRTGLIGADILFKWEGEEAQSGILTVYWVDDRSPEILDRYVIELGNGTILIIVIATDNTEDWIGTGISDVILIDKRAKVDEVFPLSPKSIEISPGIFQYIFRYNYNQIVPGFGDYFSFSFNETLKFALRLVDKGTPDFPGDLGVPNAIETNVFILTAGKDDYKPVFISQEGVIINSSFLTNPELSSVQITDGTVEFSVIVQDMYWSGLKEDSVVILITDLSKNSIFRGNMNLSSTLTDIRSELEFSVVLTLNVLHDYEVTVIVTDNYGNTNNHTIILLVEDRVAPRVLEVQSQKTTDRKLRVTVVLEENGLGIEFVRFRLGDSGLWYNLSKVGGSGGTTSSTASYSAVIPLPLFLDNIITSKTFDYMVWVRDRSGNENLESSISSSYFDSFEATALLFEPWILLILGLVLIISIVAGIRIASRTEGYDMRQIISESERISREEILIQMDEYALGVTVNFFDQVQGPVPVIWEPQLLEDHEQVMLDLSDKSFSTLEFVGIDEYERSGTFDFSTGSYECTALGYSFAIENPGARGGKENLTIVLLLRREWGENLLIFQDELLGKLREIRVLVENKQPPSEIEAKARELRELVSRLMIAFNHIYLKEEKKEESESKVE